MNNFETVCHTNNLSVEAGNALLKLRYHNAIIPQLIASDEIITELRATGHLHTTHTFTDGSNIAISATETGKNLGAELANAEMADIMDEE